MTTGTGLKIEGAVKPSSIEVDAYENAIFAHRYTEIPSNMQMKVDYNFSNKTQRYIGYAPRGLLTSQDGWLIHQFLYSLASFPNQLSARVIAYDSWDNRGSANYA